MSSLAGQQAAQCRLAVPGDVGDAPILLELDQVEDDGLRLAQVLERDGRARLAGGDITERNLDAVDLPILRIDEGIGAELAHLAARLPASLMMSAASAGAKYRRTAASLLSSTPFASLPLYWS